MATSSAEFVIAIQQQMKGESAVSELEKIVESVREGVGSFKALDASALKTQEALEATAKKSADVAAEMAKLNSAASVDVGAFRKLQTAADALAKKEAELKAELTTTTAEMAKQQAAITQNAARMQHMRAATKQSAAGAALANTKFGELAGAFGAMGGPLGSSASALFQLGDGFQKLSQAGGPTALMVGGLALVTALVVALGAAVVGTAVAITAWGIKAANAARQQKLLYEATYGGATAAAAMSAEFRGLEKSTGVSRDRLFDLSKQLKEAKVTGAAATTALRAIATQEAAIGDGGTADLIKELKTGQKSAAAMAKEIETQYGSVVRRKMIGLDESMGRLKGNISALFSGLNIESFLQRFANVVDLFDESNASGRVMRGVFERVFQPLVDGAAAAIPQISLFAASFVVQLLKIGVATKPIWSALSKVFNFKGDATSTTMKTAEIAASALAAAVAAIAVAVTVVTVATQGTVGAWQAAWAMASAGFSAFVTGTVGHIAQLSADFSALGSMASAAWAAVSAAVSAAVATIAATDLGGVAIDLIDGFVEGIKAGASKVTAAVGDLGKIAKDGLMDAIGAASPAKEFMEPGLYSAQGYAVGVDKGAGEVEDSISSMVSGGGALPLARAAGPSGPITINITVNGGGDAANIARRVREELEDAFSDLTLTLGGEPTSEAA